jgi:hypothetical protein
MPAVKNSPGWAEMMIPLQGMDISKIILNSPQKVTGPGIPVYAQDRPLASLQYHDTLYRLSCLSILTPFLTVIHWDSSIGKLELQVLQGTSTYIKFNLLQEFIINTITKYQRSWLEMSNSSATEIRSMFQHILSGERLILYLHGPNPEQKTCGRIWSWNKGWFKGANSSSFKVGDEIRVALRLQGVCFLHQAHGSKFRIQHQTVAVYHKNKV